MSPQMNMMTNTKKNLPIVMCVSQTYIPLFYNKSHHLSFSCSLHPQSMHPNTQSKRISTHITFMISKLGFIKSSESPTYVVSSIWKNYMPTCPSNSTRIPTLKSHGINAQVLTQSFSFLDHLIHIHQLLFIITSYLWKLKLVDILQAL